jgi:uncharacterized protein (DUF433 family)
MSVNSNLSDHSFERPTPATLLKPADAPIQQDPEKLSGHPTIGAKRVPADVLINYLASGQTIHDFLNDYDAVTENEVLAVLGVIKQAILDGELTGIRLRDEEKDSIGVSHLAGAFTDDLILLEICEQAYRLRDAKVQSEDR